jgi:acetyl-CoA carboxylase biotin carboxyl carrier protein
MNPAQLPHSASMNISQNDVTQILKVIDETQNLDEVELVIDGLRLHVRRSPPTGAQPVAVAAVERAAAPASPAATTKSPAPAIQPAAPAQKREFQVPEGLTAIRAPMLGSFYRAASPGEPAFAEVGQQVKADDTVCLIEVMKLFNSIKAGVDGEVVQILVEDGQLVEYNQVLVLIRPSRKAG